MGTDIETKSASMRGASRLDAWEAVIRQCNLKTRQEDIIIVRREEIESVIRVIDKMWPSEFLSDLDYKAELIRFFVEAFYRRERVEINF